MSIKFFVPGADNGRNRISAAHIGPASNRAAYNLTIPRWVLESMKVSLGDRIAIGYKDGTIFVRPDVDGFKLVKPSPGARNAKVTLAASHFTNAGLLGRLGRRVDLQAEASADGVGFELRFPLGGS